MIRISTAATSSKNSQACLDLPQCHANGFVTDTPVGAGEPFADLVFAAWVLAEIMVLSVVEWKTLVPSDGGDEGRFLPSSHGRCLVHPPGI
jgi:hypothetical protein